MLSQRSLRLSSFLFTLFSLFCSMAVISTILSSRSLICSSASVILLLIPSSVFFISLTVLFNCLFFSTSRSLLNTSYMVLICATILFLRSWIIFTIITLNSFSGRLCISTSLVILLGFYLFPSSGTYSPALSFCLTFCDCDFCSAGCRVVFLASAACPLMNEAV